MRSRARPRLPHVALLLATLSVLAGGAIAKAQHDSDWKEVSPDSSVTTGDRSDSAVEISLRYRESQLRLVRVRRLHGFRGDRGESEKPTYSIRIIGSDGESLKTVGFANPTTIYGAPLRTEAEVDSRHAKKHASKVDEKKFSITVDLPEGAHKVQLLDGVNRLVDERVIPPATTRHKKLKTKTIKGSDVQRKKDDSGAYRILREIERLAANLGDLAIGEAHAQAATAELTIVFVGDMYADTDSDRSRFESDVERVIDQLLAVEPFDCHAEKFVFQLVANTESLGCYYSSAIDRLLLCNDTSATEVVNDAGIAYDYIAVLVNSPGYGGSGGSIPVSYNGPDAPKVFLHEFGHAFAGLKDEYVLHDSPGASAEEVDKNCFMGTPPASDWSGLVASSDYHAGCNHSNWYRSSSTSIMRTLESSGFNLVSRHLVARQIASDVGTSPDAGLCPATPPMAPPAPVLLIE